MRHQFKKNPPVDVETNVLGRTALPWRFRNPKIVGGCFQLRFSSQDVELLLDRVCWVGKGAAQAAKRGAAAEWEVEQFDKRRRREEAAARGHRALKAGLGRGTLIRPSVWNGA